MKSWDLYFIEYEFTFRLGYHKSEDLSIFEICFKPNPS